MSQNGCFLKYGGTPNYLNGDHFSIETHSFKTHMKVGGRCENCCVLL